MIIDFSEKLNEAIVNNPTNFTSLDGEEHNRHDYTSASEIFQCPRKLCYNKRNFRRDPGRDNSGIDPGVGDRGKAVEHQVELRTRQALQELNCELHYSGDAQRSLTYENVSATPDGLIVSRGSEAIEFQDDRGEVINIPANGSLVIEYKSKRCDADLSKLETGHEWQVKLQIELFKKCIDFARLRCEPPQEGVIMYTDCGKHTRRTFFKVDKPNSGFLPAALELSHEILNTKDPSDLKPYGQQTGECKWCPFTVVCGEAVLSGMPKKERILTPVEEGELDKLLAKRFKLKEMKDATELQVKSVEGDIKGWLQQHDIARARTSAATVSYTTITPNPRPDPIACRRYFADDSRIWRQVEPYDRLFIKRL